MLIRIALLHYSISIIPQQGFPERVIDNVNLFIKQVH